MFGLKTVNIMFVFFYPLYGLESVAKIIIFFFLVVIIDYKLLHNTYTIMIHAICLSQLNKSTYV